MPDLTVKYVPDLVAIICTFTEASLEISKRVNGNEKAGAPTGSHPEHFIKYPGYLHLPLALSFQRSDFEKKLFQLFR